MNETPATKCCPGTIATLIFLAVAGLSGAAWVMFATAAEPEHALIFDGGHETEPRDGGRPVVLVAAGLGVTPDVFREAFLGVTPAKDGKPSPEQARSNKAALMKVLEPHGVSGARLDEVSDFYRYKPQSGQLWRNVPANGHAIIENGKVKQIVLTAAGAGYSSPPKVVIKGMEAVALKVTLHFDKDLKKNGSIASIDVDGANR